MSSPVTWLPMLTFTPPSLCLESARTSYLQDDRNNPRPTDRLSLLSWNPGPARGSRDAFIRRVVGRGKSLRCRKLQITCNTLRSMQDSLSHSSEIARSCSTGTSLSAMSSPSITTLPQTRVMQIGLWRPSLRVTKQHHSRKQTDSQSALAVCQRRGPGRMQRVELIMLAGQE